MGSVGGCMTGGAVTMTQPTVYCVAGDAAVRKSLPTLVESTGLDARAYESADEFLADFQADAPGCVVAGVRLPGTSGLQLLEKLRSDDVHIPFIVITAHGTYAPPCAP